MSNRDTQFAGFAKLLWDGLHIMMCEERDGSLYISDALRYKLEKYIAQRAYDLLCFHVGGSSHDLNSREMARRTVDRLPDMASWPALPLADGTYSVKVELVIDAKKDKG